MKGNLFFDTNILIYAHTDVDNAKQQKAGQLIQDTSSAIVSTQVIQEFINACLVKFEMEVPVVQKLIGEIARNFIVLTNTFQTIEYSLSIKDKYHFSFWDSMIIAAAIESDCNILYSEDLQDGQIIEGVLTVVNPFTKT